MVDERTRKRFEAKVDRSGGPDACHPWTAYLDKYGYGMLRVGGRKGKLVGAHVLALEAKLGRTLRRRKCSLHSCDNPPCVNERHLYEGTRKQNTGDAMVRGRLASGERHGSAKLAESEAAAILAMHPSGKEVTKLAISHGVSETAIRDILNGRTWKRLPRPSPAA